MDETREMRARKTQQLPRTIAVRQTRRVVVGLLGGTVFLLGVLLALPGVPGPGLLVMILGLTILSWEFHWAKRLLFRLKQRWKQMRADRAARRAGR